ncbi:unnamed protein product [Cylicocyclus nassatus]|uniref:Protein kinase domain-containing protein n=1 Tax=Cylicocyclus nassatus TaxID=53992 RepID=A0AA36GMF0_CYLNA|nr:unnamed protein product [Cylicocyclus nassatus]
MNHFEEARRLDAFKSEVAAHKGVSYLRQKKIIHKDLRSKNIFIESKNKDVITNFGLFSMGRLRYPRRNNAIWTSSHWLAYMAPELIRLIDEDCSDLPFT